MRNCTSFFFEFEHLVLVSWRPLNLKWTRNRKKKVSRSRLAYKHAMQTLLSIFFPIDQKKRALFILPFFVAFKCQTIPACLFTHCIQLFFHFGSQLSCCITIIFFFSSCTLPAPSHLLSRLASLIPHDPILHQNENKMRHVPVVLTLCCAYHHLQPI